MSRAARENTRRSGRPARLSREALVAAADAIVRREGIDALTMRRVAEAVGSSPMAIYRHVRDKDALLVLLLDRLAAELPRPRLPRDPHDRLMRLWTILHDGMARHPWVVDVLAAGELMAPSVLWHMERIMAAYEAAGLDPAGAAAAYRACWLFTVGELVVARASARAAAPDRRTFQIRTVTGADAARLPSLARAAAHWRPDRYRGAYAAGLAALLDGLLART